MRKGTESLKDHVYRSLAESIVRGEYRPHEIINESALTERFGCSKAPVREALGTLCVEGVLRNFPRFGYEVIPITRDDVEDMLRYRQILECGLLRTSFTTITPKKIELLRTIDQKCHIVGDTMWNHWDSNSEFHAKLLSFSGNQYAYKQLTRVLGTLKYAYGQLYWDKWEEQMSYFQKPFHEQIIEGIETQNLELSIHSLEMDIQDFSYFSHPA